MNRLLSTRGQNCKKKYKSLFVVTPGIRLPGDKNDQSRVVSPYDALIKNKADAIVSKIIDKK